MKPRKLQDIRIVVVGGGTGLSTLLRGLKRLTPHLTAVVAVTDDGGSSGALRRELGVLPPGDIRNCLVALSEEENLMAQLFQYRFPSAGSLAGHSFGNLFITAMSSLSGGFDRGITRASEVLAIRGQVLPATLSAVTLRARLKNGKVIKGESNIGRSSGPVSELIIWPSPPPAAPRVIEAIGQADAIVLGPGSLYTSIIANLLIQGIVPALRKTAAPKIYVCNIMTQPGETTGYTLTDHLRAIEDHGADGLLDVIIANYSRIPENVARRYAKEGACPVRIDRRSIKGVRMVKTNLISPEGVARHDPGRLASVIKRILREERIAL